MLCMIFNIEQIIILWKHFEPKFDVIIIIEQYGI